MVLDYSKWDQLELSDDSDVEVHPNVDKRSFIRAKQNQIHQQREQRRHDIKTLKYERIINDGLLSRIDKLLETLKKHEDSSASPDELLFGTIMDFASKPAEDQAPPPPEGVHTHEKEQPKYSQMMGALVDQVKQEFEDSKPDNLFKAYIQGVEGHQTKVQDLQKELLAKLAQLEKEEGSKITSDQLHEGFNTSHVAKAAEKEKAAPGKQTEVELLNPGSSSQVSGGAANIDDDDDPANVEISPLAKKFASLKPNDYNAYLSFISANPQIVAEKETDGLLVEAFNCQMKGDEAYARQCVHQGLLLQYCRSLGPDGIKLFFTRHVTQLYILPISLTNNMAVSLRRTTALPLSSTTMSTTPITESRHVLQSSPKTALHPTTPLVWSRSNCTPLIPTPRSPSTFPLPTAKTPQKLRRVRSSIISPQIYRRLWPVNPWTR